MINLSRDQNQLIAKIMCIIPAIMTSPQLTAK